MSRHTIELPSTTSASRAIVVIGYQSGANGPHYFCYLFDATDPMTRPLWNSLFAPGYGEVQEADGFDEVLQKWGVQLPDFLKRALREDWVKNQLNTEYCWQADGSFDQIR
ncbi:hypothetical protein [Ectopseudomonas guguanensis]|uniref:hypothetical protein n=1 Tax=Ectopseudomonas guguanensis TaxID=1198456 RepID=UPI002855ABE5|nr:hypothetical protein [Pseudomonas guguanensis]MDR8015437.1 hypothetical protein [Pseudomonas guguanensis]